MKEIQYKNFSLRTHKKNRRIRKSNVCQFELTFACGLHCKHCHTDCYNNAGLIRKELDTEEIKLILDKLYRAGVIWLCFTGGDPLSREDFLEIYSYAKDKGFIITIFTNAYSMNSEIAEYLKNKPPFVIEMTLNGITKETYEKISQVKGSFQKAIAGISLITKAGLPLKIKTQITQDNLEEVPEIQEFIEKLDLMFRPAYDLNARLNGNLTPCSLRLSPKELLNLNGKKHSADEECIAHQAPRIRRRAPNGNLFNCAIGGGDGFYIDPYGNIFLCNMIRKPAFNLLKVDIDCAMNRLLLLARNRKFVTDTKCKGCNLREICRWCPGKAYVETGDMEAPIEDYCKLAKLVHRS